MTIDVGTIAAWIAALGTIGGAVFAVFKFMSKINSMDCKLDKIVAEQQHIAKGTLAALKGLKEQGCNGPVTEALAELEDHILKQAHC